MKLAAISMIRDEADIIVPFLRHLAALFDIVFLLDQRSSDGSGEVMRQACAAQAGWFYHYMDFAGRHQAEVNTVFMARAFDHGADAVFFIDSDEFVGVRAPAELQKAVLRCQERDAVGMFRLRACVPAAFNKWHFDPSDTLWISDSSSLWPKVIVTRSAFENVRGIRVSQGSHAVLSLDEEPLPYLDVGHLLHVPIRSRQQFVQKVFLSVISNLAKNNLMLKEGRHKRRLLEMIAGDELSDVVLASIASQYPPVDEISWWDSLDEFPSRGFSQRTLGVPFSNLGLREPPQSDFRRILARCLTDCATTIPRGTPNNTTSWRSASVRPSRTMGWRTNAAKPIWWISYDCTRPITADKSRSRNMSTRAAPREPRPGLRPRTSGLDAFR